MITRQEFIKKYDGKFVEVAGSANALNQCVDLANAYLRDVLNHPIVEWTNAIDFPEKLTDFEWIENTPNGIPQPGDLMIFFGYYGHISIYINGDVNSFNSFDQNFPANSPCHIQKHNYDNVFGWLRPPGGETMPDKLLKHIGCKTEDEAIEVWDKEMKFLKEAREKIVKLEQELESKPISSEKEDDINWVLNGKTEEVTKNGVKTIKNYAVRR